jgi:hypothetical protein
MKTKILGSFFAAFVLSGCATMRPMESAELELRPRAAFEMRCPAEQLKLIPLNPTAIENNPDTSFTESIRYQIRVGAQVGVEGCGNRMVYIGTREGWVANSNTSADQSNVPAPQGPVAPTTAK